MKLWDRSVSCGDGVCFRRVASQELDARRSTLAEKLARKERRRDKKRKKLQRERGDADDDGKLSHTLLLTSHFCENKNSPVLAFFLYRVANLQWSKMCVPRKPSA